jgi:hypothetical protein
MGLVTFQVKKGRPTSWVLRQREVMAIKPETNEKKYIGYYKGTNILYSEDVTNKDLKASVVPDFTFNASRNKCELSFDDSDKALLNYLKAHPEYNKTFEQYSEEIESEKVLGRSETIKKALSIVSESDDLRIQALGLTVLGMSAFGKKTSVIKAKLNEKAIDRPKEVINAREDTLFEQKFISSLAICSGVIKTNNTMTALVWSDNNGLILNLATGENFVEKLARHLADNSKHAASLLQEIGNRMETEAKVTSTSGKDYVDVLEAKNKQLEAELRALKGNDGASEELKAVREQYARVTGKDVHWSKKNDLDWMLKKIEEAES